MGKGGNSNSVFATLFIKINTECKSKSPVRKFDSKEKIYLDLFLMMNFKFQ